MMRFGCTALISAIALVSAGTSQARAADLYQSAAPHFDWNGGYVGGYAGYLFGDGSRTSIDLPDNSFSPDGVVGGATAGWNFQIESVVFGVEADIGASGISDGFSIAGNGFDFSSDFLTTFRGRVGLPVDRLLIYGTGGFAGLDANLNDIGFGSDSRFMVGWTAGGGVEWAVSDNFTVRAEALYVDFGTKTFDAGGFSDEVSVDGLLVRGGAVFHF